MKRFLEVVLTSILLILIILGIYLFNHLHDENKKFVIRCENSDGVVLLTTKHTKICVAKPYLIVPEGDLK